MRHHAGMPCIVYLDQAEWIELSRARCGRPVGPGAADALLLLSEGVRSGHCRTPLSLVHYIETWHRGPWASRRDLAKCMLELSGGMTIAPLVRLVEPEIDAALAARYGRPRSPRRPQPFGQGRAHAFGRPVDVYRTPPDAPLTDAQRVVLERAANAAVEVIALSGPPDPAEVPGLDMQAEPRAAAAHAELLEALRRDRTTVGLDRGDGARRATLCDTYEEIWTPLGEACNRAAITPQEFWDTDQARLAQLLCDIPTAHVCNELRLRRVKGDQRPWSRNDLGDLLALSGAIVYCDVVVTERHWAALARGAGLDVHYDTTILHSLAQLTTHLARAV